MDLHVVFFALSAGCAALAFCGPRTLARAGKRAAARPRPRSPSPPSRRAAPDSVPDALMRRFRTALPDPGVRRRLLQREGARFPGEGEAKLIDRILFSLERDRS